MLVDDGHERVAIPAVAVAEVVDTAGAGDAFSAAYAVAIAEGRSPVAAARFGALAGAFAVTRREVVPGLGTRAELEAFAARQPPDPLERVARRRSPAAERSPGGGSGELGRRRLRAVGVHGRDQLGRHLERVGRLGRSADDEPELVCPCVVEDLSHGLRLDEHRAVAARASPARRRHACDPCPRAGRRARPARCGGGGSTTDPATGATSARRASHRRAAWPDRC